MERSWEVFGRPRRPQDAHKTHQDGHKTPQDATMTVQDGPKTRPRCSEDAPKMPSRRKLRQDVPVRPRSAKTLKNKGKIMFFFQAEDGIRDAQESRGLGDVYKRQVLMRFVGVLRPFWPPKNLPGSLQNASKTPPKTSSNIGPT